jgi:hypothetical protein
LLFEDAISLHLSFPFLFAAAVLAVSVLAKDEEPEKLGTVIGIDLGKFSIISYHFLP